MRGLQRTVKEEITQRGLKGTEVSTSGLCSGLATRAHLDSQQQVEMSKWSQRMF